MAFEKNKTATETPKVGKRLYSHCVRIFREGYISICIYKNVYATKTYYDVVIYRKIKQDGKISYRRNANYKPYDVPRLITLLKDVKDFLDSVVDADSEVRY